MKAGKVDFAFPVTLVGGGALSRPMLDAALAEAPGLVAADGAADRLFGWGLTPDAVIGDMDSISDPALWEERVEHFVCLREQDSTDFEKCLNTVAAPFLIGAGFIGGRTDHMLAVFHAMLASEADIVLLGEQDAIALLPPGRSVEIAVEAGAVVSLFPLLPACGTASAGLEWPVDGLAMAPGRQIGTSNRAVSDRITVGMDSPGVLILLEQRFLVALIRALFPRG